MNNDPLFQLVPADGVVMATVVGILVMVNVSLKSYTDVSVVPVIFIRYAEDVFREEGTVQLQGEY